MNKQNDLKNILFKSPENQWPVVGPEELKKKDEELRRKILENDSKQSELTLKESICRWVKRIVSIYLLFIAFIIGALVFGFGHLEKSVAIALLTTTTINILGLPLMIIKSLFPGKSD